MDADTFNALLAGLERPERVTLAGGLVTHTPEPCGNATLTATTPCEHPHCPLAAHGTYASLHVRNVDDPEWIARMAAAAIAALGPHVQQLHRARTCRWN